MNRFYTSSLLLTFLLMLGAHTASAQCNNLFFSEYIEGSSNNKLLEIYNPTPNAVDLSNYLLAAYNNGDTEITNSLEWPAGTMLAPGDVYIVSNGNADSALLALADTTSSVTFFNGNDAIVLRDTTAGMDIDIIGVVGVDPGSEWTVGSGGTLNHTLVRRSSVNDGETDWSIAVLGWVAYDINFADSLGFHNIESCDAMVNPVASFVEGTASGTEDIGADTAYIALSQIDQAYSIMVSITGGDATSGVDFALVNGTGSYPISMGQTELIIPFTITDDGDEEGNETFEITISEQSGMVTIGNSTFEYTILDDDTEPTEPCSYAFFSEYIEGSSNNKVLEIFNPTDGPIDLSDYRINRYNNGNTDTSGVFYWPEGTMLGSMEVYIIANPSADSAMLAVSDTTDDITFYNGDDALELENMDEGLSVDIIGVIGEDPGTNWPVGTGATSEFTLVRDPEVRGGQTNWSLAAGTWLVYPQNFTDSLGAHYMIPCSEIDPCDTTEILIEAAILNESVEGAEDGAIDLSIGGNSAGNFEFAWTGPDNFESTAEDISDLAPGEYCVVVSDANDCLEDACFTIEEGPGPCDTIDIILSAVVTDESADGADDGSIDLTVSGNGVEPYEFTWNQGSNTEDIMDLADGEYCVLVEDDLGCIADTCFFIQRGPSPCDTTDIIIGGVVTHETFLGDEDGSIDLTITGNGTEPLDITWSGPDGFEAFTEDLDSLAPGEYCVLIEDQNNCMEDMCFTVNPGLGPCDTIDIVITAVITDESLLGANDGAIDVTVTGGQPDYSYLWSNSSTDEDLDGLAPGEYTLTVSDANACLEDTTFVVGEGEDPCDDVDIDITFIVTPESGSGAADGAIDATVSGGTPPYSYSWDNGGITEDLSGLEGGSYELTVTDSFGCTETEDVEVETLTSVNEIASLRIFDVFPNPASSIVYISLRFERSLEVQLEVSDLSGRIISGRAPAQMDAGTITLKPDWPAGIYFLKVITDEGIAVEPLIIAR